MKENNLLITDYYKRSPRKLKTTIF